MFLKKQKFRKILKHQEESLKTALMKNIFPTFRPLSQGPNYTVLGKVEGFFYKRPRSRKLSSSKEKHEIEKRGQLYDYSLISEDSAAQSLKE